MLHRYASACRIIAGLLLSLPLIGCAEAKPRIESVQPRVTGIDWTGVDVTFEVNVRNPLPMELRAPAGRYAVEVAGAKIINAEDVPPIAIPSRDRGVVPLPVRFEYAEVLALLRSTQDVDEVPYRLSGAVTLAAAGLSLDLPFSHDGEVPVLQMPAIEILGLKQGSVGFAGVGVTVSAEIENPNAFEIGVRDLQFELTIADSRVGSVRVEAPNRLKARSKTNIQLIAEVGGADAIASVVTSPGAAEVRVRLRGEFETPFGKVSLARD